MYEIMTRFSLDVFDLSFLFFSWYIKPLIGSTTFFTSLQFLILSILLFIIGGITGFLYHVSNPVIQIFSTLKLTSFLSIFMGIKFVILIALLIVVRGGIPRYRYDFLTKLGWIKTLSLVLAIFLINLLLSYL
jgi:NADH:ubiquinone oxidoreductase subunit H